jgi:hypothetical protein
MIPLLISFSPTDGDHAYDVPPSAVIDTPEPSQTNDCFDDKLIAGFACTIRDRLIASAHTKSFN